MENRSNNFNNNPRLQNAYDAACFTSIVSSILFIVFLVLCFVYRDSTIVYTIPLGVFFVFAFLGYVAMIVLRSISTAPPNVNPANNIANSPMSTEIELQERVFQVREDTRPSAQSPAPLRTVSSRLRSRLGIIGIPFGSDREQGSWVEPDTPEPDANLRRSVDRDNDLEEQPRSCCPCSRERSLVTVIEQAFPQERH